MSDTGASSPEKSTWRTKVGLAEMLRGVIEAGLPPEEVAGQVLAAVRSKQFYVLTHDGSEVAVSARAEAIVANQPPPFFMPQ